MRAVIKELKRYFMPVSSFDREHSYTFTASGPTELKLLLFLPDGAGELPVTIDVVLTLEEQKVLETLEDMLGARYSQMFKKVVG